MKLHNISNGIINFEGRLLEPNMKIYVSRETLLKYEALVYKYYEEKKAVVEDVTGRALTLEEVEKIINSTPTIKEEPETKTPSYLEVVSEANKEDEQAEEEKKEEPNVENAEIKEVKTEEVEKTEETETKKSTKKRNVKK